MGRPRLVSLLAVLVLCVLQGIALRGADVLIQIDDAFVSSRGGLWTIGNALVRYSLGREGSNVGVRSIADPLSDRDWHRSEGPDNLFSANGQRIEIGSSLTEFHGAAVAEHWGGVRLDLGYRVPSAALDVTRSYVVYPGSSVVETWTTYQVTGTRAVLLADLASYTLAVEPGRVRWVSGRSIPDERGGPFTVNEHELADGQTFELGSKTRASETSVPWFSIRSGDAEFFGAILWGGSWNLKLRGGRNEIAVEIGLPPFTTSVGPGGTLESPHAIFGITNAFVPETSMALQSFFEKGLRHGRPYGSHVTYNTWHSFGMSIDEASILSEMSMAAALGIEQFVVDAGWWLGANLDDRGDVTRNWGTWRADPDRFPRGLGALSDRAHELGMRFGIWVEPERVALGTVGREGLARESFLATDNGAYQPGIANDRAQSAQVCLAGAGARDWLLAALVTFIEDVRPDSLKWANDVWVNCTRTSHGHGAADGNFRHMHGLQSILDRLRDRYPNLDIENSAGGHRLSLGMLAYSDTGGLDGRTATAMPGRHNAQGLLGVFPAPYLLSFAPGTPETGRDARTNEMSSVLRSRMSGSLGVSLLLSKLDERARADLASQIALYKQIRPILQQGTAIPLNGPPVALAGQRWSGWDVVEHVSRRTGDAVILAFNTPDSQASTVVYPRVLRQDAIYDVESADYGMIGSARGSELMGQGIEVLASAVSRGHVLILRVRSQQ
jgi:alpha-galactosidase